VSVRYRPTTSMSVVAGASVNDCDTMRTGGADAWGGGVGTGSEVRFGVGSTGVAGAAVNVGTAVAAIVGAGESVSPGTDTGPAHPPTTKTARATATSRVTTLRYPTLLGRRLVEERDHRGRQAGCDGHVVVRHAGKDRKACARTPGAIPPRVLLAATEQSEDFDRGGAPQRIAARH